MQARVQIELKFELANPEDYPEEVKDWIDAADYELDYLTIQMGDMEIGWSIGKIDIEGNDEFIRLEGDDQEGE